MISFFIESIFLKILLFILFENFILNFFASNMQYRLTKNDSLPTEN